MVVYYAGLRPSEYGETIRQEPRMEPWPTLWTGTGTPRSRNVQTNGSSVAIVKAPVDNLKPSISRVLNRSPRCRRRSTIAASWPAALNRAPAQGPGDDRPDNDGRSGADAVTDA